MNIFCFLLVILIFSFMYCLFTSLHCELSNPSCRILLASKSRSHPFLRQIVKRPFSQVLKNAPWTHFDGGRGGVDGEEDE